MQKHELKSWPADFEATRLLQKKHDFRKNDRDFQVRDLLWLREFEPCPSCSGVGTVGNGSEFGPRDCLACKGEKGKYTGRELWRLVTYVAQNAHGIPAGYCVMSIADPNPHVSQNEADEFCTALDNFGRATYTVDDIREMLQKFLVLRETDEEVVRDLEARGAFEKPGVDDPVTIKVSGPPLENPPCTRCGGEVDAYLRCTKCGADMS